MLVAAAAMVVGGALLAGGPAPVPVRRLVSAQSGDGVSTELNASHVAEHVPLDPRTTALVLVDVWESHDPLLVANYRSRLLPLLEAARQLGMLVVHAPSSNPNAQTSQPFT